MLPYCILAMASRIIAGAIVGAFLAVLLAAALRLYLRDLEPEPDVPVRPFLIVGTFTGGGVAAIWAWLP